MASDSLKFLEEASLEATDVDPILDRLRILRTPESLQTLVDAAETSKIVSITNKFSESTNPDIVKISAQVLFNLSVLVPEHTSDLWRIFGPKCVQMFADEASPDNVPAMIVHRCCRMKQVKSTDKGFGEIISCLLNSESDESLLGIESLALIPGAFEALGPHKLSVFECLNALHEIFDIMDAEDEVYGEFFGKFVSHFEKLADDLVLKRVVEEKNVGEVEMRELVACLDFLGTSAAKDETRDKVQKDSLVVCVTHFLKALEASEAEHPLKEDPVENLEAISQVRSGIESMGITDSPAFELKQKLLKLLGNIV